MRWLWLDLRARMRQRTTFVAVGLLAYAVLAVPFLLAEPPPHVQEAVRTWFGADRGFVLFLYLWTDIAMNKLIAILAVVLAGQTLVRERDTGVLDVLRSKPITLPALFLVRAGSAIALLVLLYVGAAVVAMPWFAARVEGFEPIVFLLSTLVHSGAAAFAVALAATTAVVVGRRTPAMILGLLLLLSLIGGSFAGFYVPDWAPVASLNPFAQGVTVVGHVTDLAARHVVVPLVLLGASTAAVLAVGARAAPRWEVVS